MSLDFLSRLQHLSQQVLSGVSSLKTLDFLLPHETQSLFVDGLSVPRKAVSADTAIESKSTIVDAIVAQCERSPDSVAVKYANSSICYSDLDIQSRQWAGILDNKGVKQGDRVVVCLDPGLALYPVLLGVLKLGAVYVPADSGYPAERINYIVKDSNATLIVTQTCVLSRMDERSDASDGDFGGDFGGDSAVLIENVVDDLLRFSDFDTSPYHPAPDSLMYVIYTSGSTGKPKGAGVYHRGVSNLLRWYIDTLNINHTDACLLVSSIGFDLTQKNPWAAFCSGARLVVPEMDQYDPDIIARALVEESITWINCAPSAFYPLVEDGDLKGYPFTCLRYVVLGGETIRLATLNQWLRTDHGNVTLINSYGPTECTDVVASYSYSPSDSAVADDAELSTSELSITELPIGEAIPNVELYIVDARNQRLAPGLVGELCVGGDAVGAGYMGNQELTDLSFVKNPFGEGLLYKTGDLARLLPESGQIAYVGRKDFQVKVRGLRIELGEIEFAIREQDAVIDALALVDGDSIVAYAVLDKSFSNIETRTVIDSLHLSLPDFMVPNSLVILDKWPLTSNGKVDRKRLPQPTSQSSQEYVAPTTDTEIRLANIWCDVLNIEKVGVFDNFFDLGGHSLLAARVISKLRKGFSIEISLRVLFEMRTVSEISRYIDRLNWAVQSQAHGSTSSGQERGNQDGKAQEVGGFDEPEQDGSTEEGFL